MKSNFTWIAFLTAFFSFAQDPAIEWQKTIGGNAADVMTSFEPTNDGGYIIGGYTASNISGEKTENSNGQLDIWIVKINASGTIQWQNTIGGSGDDFVNVVKQTSDGGYIVLAGSDSSISGDKTENSRGGLDYWIIKLTNTGAIDWQKTYGGANPDFDVFGQQTSDGGYVVAGYSDSGATGDKTEASNGQRDYWVLKLNATGNIVWQNAIGGSLVDRVQAAIQCADGNYVIGGFSFSPVSGDKTETNYGGSDYWIVKLDTSGNIIWQNTIGGSASDAFRDLIQTADGGYLLGGYSLSNISGEKTENSNGDYDYWIVKLSSTGAIEWQNTIGGAGIDYLRDVKQLNDGSYMIAGYSNSNVSGDKTENSNGGYDYWIVKLNASGTVVSQNSIGGSADESGPFILPMSDGGFMMACASASSISGDKSENSRGLEDYWIFKVTPAILGVENHTAFAATNVYPNPFCDKLTVDFGESQSNVTITVTDLLGRTVLRQQSDGVQTTDLEINAPTGMYLVSVENTSGRKTFKVSKQ